MNEVQLEAVLQSLAGGIILVDTTGRVVFCNDAFAHVCGFASRAEVPLDLEGLDGALVLFDAKCGQVALRDWPPSRVLRGEEIAPVLVELHRIGGAGWRSVRLDCHVVPSPGGAVRGVLMEANDVTVEEDLRRSHARYRTFFEVAAVGNALVDPTSGLFTLVNDRYCEITGYSREELFSLRVRELTHPEDRDTDWDKYLQMVRGELPEYSNEKRYVRKDGRVIWVHVTARALRDAAGTALATAGVVLDVTEWKETEARLRESMAQLRQLAEAIPQLVWIINADGSPYYLNQRWLSYAGVDPASPASTWLDAVHPEDRSRVVGEWRRSLDAKSPFETELRVRNADDGGYRWFLARAVPVLTPAGKVSRWFGTATDIHEQKELQLRLAEALETRDEFLSIAGHELKTPLAALLMHLESLQRADTLDTPGARLRERLGKAVAAGRKLASLINQLLDVSRIQARKFVVEPVPTDLAALVREAVARQSDTIPRGGSSLVLQAPASLPGEWDEGRIDQVLTNLLSNAVKYGEGRPIDIRLSRQDGSAVLSVSDHGIGIPPGQLERIFNRFERAGAPREYGGFGLGLWISRQIVEASGGHVDVESAPEHGSTFTVFLPIDGKHGAGPRS
jgi:PAS domain S-box-containing protein